MIPGLEQRLMEGSSEDIVHIAELVRRTFYFQHIQLMPEFARFREGLRMRGPTIQRV